MTGRSLITGFVERRSIDAGKGMTMGSAVRLTGLAALLWVVLAVVSVTAVSAEPLDCYGNPAAGFGVADGCFDGQVTAGPLPDPLPNPGVPADPANFAPPYVQAAGRPFEASTQILFNRTDHPQHSPGVANWPVEPVKDILVDVPPGLVGSPAAVEHCRSDQLADPFAHPTCPSASQVGQIQTRVSFCLFPGFCVVAVSSGLPLYSMVAPPGVPARFAANIAGTIVTIDGELRSGSDYGVSVNSKKTSEGLALVGADAILWGTPAAEAHDAQRACPGLDAPPNAPPASDPDCPVPFTRPAQRAFLRMPTSCTAPGEGLTTTARVDSWFDPGNYETVGFESHLPGGLPTLPSQGIQAPPGVGPTDSPGIVPADWGAPQGPEGCGVVPFNPSVSVEPTSTQADSPTGLRVDLSVPQTDDPGTLPSSDLKRAVVTLPEGMVVNPSAADGLQACSSAQIDLDGQNTDPSCPAASKIGTVTVDTPLLEEQLDGAVYLAKQGDNPFNSLLAMYIVAKGPGVVVKLPGHIEADPVSGRLKATFDDQPQLPFSNLHLELFDGSRAPLITPKSCGSYSVSAVLSPWARPDSPVSRGDSFQITSGPGGSPCPDGSAFSPSFAAGTADAAGGGFSPFGLQVSRRDGEQELASLNVALPQGLLAKLAGVPLCPQSAITDTSAVCPAGSRVGTVHAGAGAGSSPFFLRDQPIFLTEGYKGAPYGLAVVTDVVAGPFSLGTVVVRQALHVDRDSAQASVVSDRFPTILQGIPLDIRSVIANVDRAGFTRMPTDCSAKQITAQIASVQGQTASRSVPFQASDCARLGFKPKLALRLTGRRQVKTGRHPGVRAVVTQPANQAGIESTVVRLPKSLALDPDNAGALCEFVDGTKPDLENHCPAGSIVGRARATSPLLNRPLAGNVYFVKNVRIDPRTGNQIRTLPMIVVALRGEIAINLKGTSSTTRAGRLVNTFASVPDAPVSRFNLNIRGGNNGILAVTATRRGNINICASPQTAEADIDAHNGRRADQDIRIKTPCSRAAKARAKRAAARRARR